MLSLIATSSIPQASAEALGSAVVVLTALLSSYYLTLRIREQLRGANDPRRALVSRSELDDLRAQISAVQRESRNERDALEQRFNTGHATLQELIRRNAEHIAVLIAQADMLRERIDETAQRIGRLEEL